MTTRSSISRSPVTGIRSSGRADGQLDVAARDGRGEDGERRGDDLGEVDDLVGGADALVLDLGEGEQLGDQGEQPVAVGADPLDGVELAPARARRSRPPSSISV